MKKLSEKIKDWVVENPDKFLYCISGVITVGTGIVMYKLHLMDTKHCDLKEES